MQKIILASQSPRRKMLLEWAEIPFEVSVSDADESFPAQMDVYDVAVFIARKKAMAVANAGNNTQNPADSTYKIIVAADTIVVLDNEVIGKPVDRNDAVNILTKLSGRSHRVITGVVILHPRGEESFYDATEVEFNKLTKEELEFYVDKYKPYDKAGAYAIQEWIGVVGIRRIIGDFYNVMGLPVSRVVQALKNITEAFPPSAPEHL